MDLTQLISFCSLDYLKIFIVLSLIIYVVIIVFVR